jgi:uncharacterized protein YjbI with pentapeptide repeats
LKPENILVDLNFPLKIYLIDFGFARQVSDNIAVSSVVKGTFGFMPPEQLFNRQLTEASDLYSLGVTLICLLTGIKSTEIGNLIDDHGRVKFKSLLPKLNPRFVNWLEKMIAPSLNQRYPNARVALDALIPINILNRSLTKTQVIASVAGLVTVTLLSIMGTNFFLNNPKKGLQFDNFYVNQLVQSRSCPGCNLSGINLENVNLEAVNLQGANLSNANLSNVNLKGAKLQNTNLSKANLEGASLQKTDFSDAILEEANLKNANLEDSHLERANLNKANLTNANLNNAKLWNANLKDVQSKGIYTKDSNLKGAVMPDGSKHQ